MSIDPYQLINDLFKEGHTIEKVAMGTSMHPAIPAQCQLRIVAKANTVIRLGDIIYVRVGPGKMLIHRLSFTYRKNGKKYCQTWGDSNYFPDPGIPFENVIGKVIAKKAPEKSWVTITSNLLLYLKLLFTKYLPFYCKRLMIKLFKK